MLGALVVELADAKDKKLMWRGSATGTLSDNSDKNIKTLNNALNKLLKNYPPKEKESRRKYIKDAPMRTMTKAFLAFALVVPVYAVDDVESAVHGTVEKIHVPAKIITVKAATGTHHTFHLAKSTAVHGADAVDAAKIPGTGSARGRKSWPTTSPMGPRSQPSKSTGVGRGGLEATQGTITALDRTARTIVVRTSAGTIKTFQLSGHAAKYAGCSIANGGAKGTKVVVYSSETAGKKVGHFFEAV